MQNNYLQMMEATQALIARANDISASAEVVSNMLGVHKDDLGELRVALATRFKTIRATLEEDEAKFLKQIDTLAAELDEARGMIQGKMADTQPPVAPTKENDNAES
jgi:hypothetical protein